MVPRNNINSRWISYICTVVEWLVAMSFDPIGRTDFKTATAGGPFILRWAVDFRITTARGTFRSSYFFSRVHKTSQLTDV